jgi:hypothetical protein
VIAEIPAIESLQEQWASRRSAWIAAGATVLILGFILLGSAVTFLYG